MKKELRFFAETHKIITINTISISAGNELD